MGQALSPYLRLLEGELGRDRNLLQVSPGDPDTRLYDESDREPEPAGQKDDEKQGDLPERPGPNEAGLPGHRRGIEEMDHAP